MAGVSQAILDVLGHSPTDDQRRAAAAVEEFLLYPRQRSAMILRGAAGTGKTSLAAAVVRAIGRMGVRVVLLAPTGRAAKVFSLYAGQPAQTIHRRIYRQQTAGDLSNFSQSFNSSKNTLFIIDEASMIANGNYVTQRAEFGSGMLLDDLVAYVYGGEGCRMMLIGDASQLPPVGQADSPALRAETFEAYGLKTFQATLSAVVRQAEESGILFNATQIRAMLASGEEPSGKPRIVFKGFADIAVVRGDELIDQLSSSYSRSGEDETIVITRSNKRANIYNQGIRRTILDREDILSRGDQLLIVKNNYSVSIPVRNSSDGSPSDSPQQGKGVATGVFNGDRCRVERLRNVRQAYGFTFADVTLSMPDYDDAVIQATCLLDTLSSEAPSLSDEQQRRLFENVMADYEDIPQKAERLRRIKTDIFYNALQIKFGYAMTCHKAQGGGWAEVYIDQGYIADDQLGTDYLRWLYTAFTRATERLFLVNYDSNG